MSRKNKIELSIVAIIIIAAVSLAYQFTWGKLFPYSPIILGFEKHELSNTIIYVQNGAKYDDYQRIDTLIPSVDDFHELKFTHKPQIFIFRDKESYLQRSTSKARFCAFYNGNIVVSPWAIKEAEEGKISLEIYLKHELSHSLIFQNTGILSAYKYPNWLLEGIAVYSANQMGTSWYPSKEDTYNYIKQGNFMPPNCFRTDKGDQIRLDVKHRNTFMYSEFACIVDYLIQTAGKEKFIAYMKEFLKSSNYDKIFKKYYGIDFDKFLIDFKAFVHSHVK